MPGSRNKNLNWKDVCLLCKIFLPLMVCVMVPFLIALTELATNTLAANTFTFKKGDQFIVSEKATDLYTNMCQQYTINLKQPAEVALVQGGAKMQKENFTYTDIDFYKNSDYNILAFSLFSGSEIKMKTCTIINFIADPELLLIKSDEDYQKFKNGECSQCALKSSKIKLRDNCTSDWPLDLEYNVTSSDNYYIIIKSKLKKGFHFKGQYIFSHLTLIKNNYILDDAKQTCSDKSSCTLDLDYASNEDIIVKFEVPLREMGLNVYANTKCHYRALFFGGVFGILPFTLIVICLVVMLVVWCRLETEDAPDSPIL